MPFGCTQREKQSAAFQIVGKSSLQGVPPAINYREPQQIFLLFYIKLFLMMLLILYHCCLRFLILTLTRKVEQMTEVGQSSSLESGNSFLQLSSKIVSLSSLHIVVS